jgi:putative ABC transport system ATP-binding protein
MLHLDDVHLRYNAGRTDEVVALRGVSLTLARGEFATVVGSNGAGKSSLVQVIAGSVRPSAGRVLLEGKDITRLPDYRRAGHVARVFDDPRAGTAPELSVEDNLALAMARGRRRSLRFALNTRRRARMRDELAHLGLGLEHRLSDRVGLLSAGQRQSVTMVMAALSKPVVLLLDEHLAALDPGTTAKVLALTTKVADEIGGATLMITHNMEQAIATGNRLLVMSRGSVVADFEAEQKRELTVAGLVGAITGAGDAVSDRALLREIEPAARAGSDNPCPAR